MGGHRRPRADRERMLGTASAADRREFENAWRALVGEFGLPPARSLIRMAMMRTATRWASLVAAEQALAEARRVRLEGRGWRPSQAKVNQLANRAALEDKSYEEALAALRELPGPHRSTLDELLDDLHWSGPMIGDARRPAITNRPRRCSRSVRARRYGRDHAEGSE
jgi:hypothetical protein